MKYTRYFAKVLRRRPEIRLEWVMKTISDPDYTVIQIDKRFRYWKWIDEAEKYLRVITLEDRETVHNAFFDRRFKK